jgi:hypothetical protein
MAEKLTFMEMVQLVDNILQPKGRGFTSEQINQQLLLFCINCPDPAAAMDIVLEARAPVTTRQLVDKALACPPRDLAHLPESELALTHPLRYMKVDSENPRFT